MKYLTAERSVLSGNISIPASKSHTIRAIAIATMAEGTSYLEAPLFSDDALSAMEAARKFGAIVEQVGDDLRITGIGSKRIPDGTTIDVGNSGTTLRIFTALAALADTRVTFDGDQSIRRRPMTSLFNALRNLGASIESTDEKCPFTIQGTLKGNATRVDGISSQFLTALLFACPLSRTDVTIDVDNLHEKPYVEITLDWLRSQNIKFSNTGLERFTVLANQKYTAFHRRIPADFSSATFALCAAAITKSDILLTGLDFSDHQGDKEVFKFLEMMGAQIQHTAEGVRVIGHALRGADIDMNNTPDALPALAVTACFAHGTTRLLNVAQARLKECDRIAAMATELTKLGASVEELPDGLIIHSSSLKGGQVHGYHDHRIIMSMALAGFSSDGPVTVDTAEAINVTYPGFVEDFKALGGHLTLS